MRTLKCSERELIQLVTTDSVKYHESELMCCFAFLLWWQRCWQAFEKQQVAIFFEGLFCVFNSIDFIVLFSSVESGTTVVVLNSFLFDTESPSRDDRASYVPCCFVAGVRVPTVLLLAHRVFARCIVSWLDSDGPMTNPRPMTHMTITYGDDYVYFSTGN